MSSEMHEVREHLIAFVLPFIIVVLFGYLLSTTTEPLHLIIYGIIAGVSLIVGMARILI